MKHLSYDIKGIQQFIFSVPKLKCMVGASALIAGFDEDFAKDLGQRPGIARVFSGGGRGVFKCEGEPGDLQSLKLELVREAHARGLDLRIGTGKNLLEAVRGADQLYPYCPNDLRGEPCTMSGLWPVRAEGTAREDFIHPVILNRLETAESDPVGAGLLAEMKKAGLFYDIKAEGLEFMKAVAAGPEDDPGTKKAAEAADAALGNRNRWAVLAMDANDAGKLFREAEKRGENAIAEMSDALKCCTRKAFLGALAEEITDWWELEGDKNEKVRIAGTGIVVLPFRPLILGGDDILCLVHSAHAMPLARGIAERFEEETRKSGVLGDNGLTISAGIAYTKVTYPLHTSIPYAESLLGSAKGKFRKKGVEQGKDEQTPGAVDWEALTDSFLDTPAARRSRSLRFKDNDIGMEIVLTKRPWKFENLCNLDALCETLNKEVPRSVRHDMLVNLRKPWAERCVCLAAQARHCPELDDMLREWKTDDRHSLGSAWKQVDKVRTTPVVDAVSLLEEQSRMESRKNERGTH